jgi:hypothetical protein
MKQKNLKNANKQKKSYSTLKLRLLTWIFSVMLAGQSIQAQAPQVIWASSPASPSLSSAIIGVQSEEVTLTVRFAVTAALTNGKIRIALPTGINLTAISSTSGMTVTPPAYPASGNVDIPVNITAASGSNVEMQARLSAVNCSQTGQKNITVSILSNGAAIPDNSGNSGARTVIADVRVPVIASTTPSATSGELQTLSDSHVFDIYLKVTNGTNATSLKIELAKDQFTGLSEFKLDNLEIPAANIETTATKVTLNLSSLSTPISENNNPKLSFKANATVFGEHAIKLSALYPASASCATYSNFFTATLRYKTQTGEARLQRGGYAWITGGSTSDALITSGLPNLPALAPVMAFDGTTVNYFKATIKNTGTVPLYQIRVGFNPLDPTIYASSCTYVKEDAPVYYQIEGAGVKTLDEDKYTASSPYGQNYLNFRVAPAFIGKNKAITVEIRDSIPAGKSLAVYVPLATGKTFDNTDWNWKSRIIGWDWYGRIDVNLNPSSCFDYNGNPAVWDTNTGGV